MKIREKMQRYAYWKVTLANNMAELQEIEKDCILPSGIRYDADKVQGSTDGDGIFRIIEQMEKRKTEISEKILEIRARMQQFEDIVDQMPTGNYKRLIHLYYIEDCKSLAEVAEKMGYSLDRINHMHGEALQEAEKTFNSATFSKEKQVEN